MAAARCGTMAAAVRVLPASPNWYCSRCSDTSGDGRLFGFAARHRISVLDVSTATPTFHGTAAIPSPAARPIYRSGRDPVGCGETACSQRFSRYRGADRAHGARRRLRLLPAPRARLSVRQRLGRRQRAAVGRGGAGAAGRVRPAPGGSRAAGFGSGRCAAGGS